MTAKQLINHSLPVLKYSDTVDDALSLFNEFKVSSLPLSENEKLVGIYTEDLLLNYDNDFTLGDIQPICEEKYILEEDPLLEAINKSFGCDSSILPVVDQDGKLIGSIEKLSLYSAFIESLSLDQTGSLLEIHVKTNDYSLSEISRIIESENAKILSVYLTSENTENLIISIKVNLLQISSVISALTRYGYDVVSYYSSEPVSNIEKDRFEQLMKYLSI